MARSGARTPHSKKKRRGMKSPAHKKGGGSLIGMRSGFKKVAKSVTGLEDASSKSNRGGLLGTIVVVVLVAAVAALIFYR